MRCQSEEGNLEPPPLFFLCNMQIQLNFTAFREIQGLYGHKNAPLKACADEM